MARKILLATVASAGLLGATGAFAQAANQNPMGLDYGSFHPNVPPQETTYYPPEAPAVVPHRTHRVRRPIY